MGELQLVSWLAVGMSILNWFVASGVLLSASALTVSPASPDVISDVNALAANAKSLSSETGSVADDIIGKLNDADKEVKEQAEQEKTAVKNQADKEKADVVAQAEREKQKLEFEASEASRKAAAADQLLADTAAKANSD